MTGMSLFLFLDLMIHVAQGLLHPQLNVWEFLEIFSTINFRWSDFKIFTIQIKKYHLKIKIYKKWEYLKSFVKSLQICWCNPRCKNVTNQIKHCVYVTNTPKILFHVFTIKMDLIALWGHKYINILFEVYGINQLKPLLHLRNNRIMDIHH